MRKFSESCAQSERDRQRAGTAATMTFSIDPVELVGGLAAGLSKDALLHPIDTLRARLDVTVARSVSSSPLAATVNELRSVIAADGFAGLYRGYTLCLLGSTPASALYFGSYHAMRRVLSGDDNVHGSSPWRDAGAGAGAEVIASLLFTPLDVLKQRMQVAPVGTGVADVVRGACAGIGAGGLWRGYFAGITVWAPYSAAYFSAYEAFRDALRSVGSGGEGGEGANAAQSASAGAAAGGVAALVTQPLDCAKTRIQVGQAGQVGKVPGPVEIFTVVRQVWLDEGASALARGGLARMMWLAPASAVTITVFESVAAALHAR